MRPQVTRSRLALALAALWAALVFGAYIFLSLIGQVLPKLISLIGD